MGRFVAITALVLTCVVSVASAQMLPSGNFTLPNIGPVSGTARVGWAEHAQGFGFTFDFDDWDDIYITRTSLRGVWLGLSLQASPADNVGLILSGGLLLRGKMGGAEDWNGGGADGLRLTEFTWAVVDGLASYRAYGDLQVLGGVRWDRMSARADYLDSADFYNLKMDAYYPVVGLQVAKNFFEGELTTRIIGWPAPPLGHVKYQYTAPNWWGEVASLGLSSGYFAEFLAQYTMTAFDSGSLDVFAIWNYTHWKTIDGTANWVDLSPPSGGDTTLRMVLHRASWTVGVAFAYDLNLL